MPAATLSLILLVLAFVLSLIAAWWRPGCAPPYRPHLGWAAMACYFLYLLLTHGPIGR